MLQFSAFVSSLDRTAIAPRRADTRRYVTRRRPGDVRRYGLTLSAMARCGCRAADSDKCGRVRSIRVALLVAGVSGIASAALPNLAPGGGAWAGVRRSPRRSMGALACIGDTVQMRARAALVADLASEIKQARRRQNNSTGGSCSSSPFAAVLLGVNAAGTAGGCLMLAGGDLMPWGAPRQAFES